MGKASATVTPVASDGPVLVTVTVNVTVSPTSGAVLSTVLAIDRSVTAPGAGVDVAVLSVLSGSVSEPVTVALLV